MRALDQREQVTLARLLQKLRKGDVLKFALESRYWSDSERLWDVWGAKTEPSDGEGDCPDGVPSADAANARDHAICRIKSLMKKIKTRRRETV